MPLGPRAMTFSRGRAHRDPRLRQLLAAFPCHAGDAQPEDRDTDRAAGEVRPLLQTGQRASRARRSVVARNLRRFGWRGMVHRRTRTRNPSQAAAMTPEGNASVPVMESGTCKGVNMHDRRRAWRLLSSNPDYVEDWQANGGPVLQEPPWLMRPGPPVLRRRRIAGNRPSGILWTLTPPAFGTLAARLTPIACILHVARKKMHENNLLEVQYGLQNPARHVHREQLL